MNKQAQLFLFVAFAILMASGYACGEAIKGRVVNKEFTPAYNAVTVVGCGMTFDGELNCGPGKLRSVHRPAKWEVTIQKCGGGLIKTNVSEAVYKSSFKYWASGPVHTDPC